MSDGIPDPMPQLRAADGPQGPPPVIGEIQEDEVEFNELMPETRVVHDVGAELGLAALRDSPEGVKPYYPYSTLIRYAIKGAPEQKLLLEDIYYAIERRFPYFTTAPTGWKNSVRHNLSLNPCFEKVSRPLTDRGKGAYWTVNDNIDPRAGIHRDRKKKKKPKKRNTDSEDDGEGHLRQSSQDGKEASDGPYMHPIVDENGNRVAYAAWPPGFSMVPGPRYALDPTEQEQPVIDDNGQTNWRVAWLNELVKLRHATYEQDTTAADPNWYRTMVERVRGAFLHPEQTEQYMQPPGHPEEGEEQLEGEDAES